MVAQSDRGACLRDVFSHVPRPGDVGGWRLSYALALGIAPFTRGVDRQRGLLAGDLFPHYASWAHVALALPGPGSWANPAPVHDLRATRCVGSWLLVLRVTMAAVW